MSQIASVTGGKSYTAETASSVVQIYKTLGSSIGRTHKRDPGHARGSRPARPGFLLLAVGAGALFQAAFRDRRALQLTSCGGGRGRAPTMRAA